MQGLPPAALLQPQGRQVGPGLTVLWLLVGDLAEGLLLGIVCSVGVCGGDQQAVWGGVDREEETR